MTVGSMIRSCLAMAVLVCAVVLGSPLSNQAVQAAEIRAASHDDYGRLVLDWQNPVDYKLEASDGRMVVRFSRPIKDNPAKVVRPLRDYVSAVSLSADRTELTVTLSPGVSPRHFTYGTAVVIDLAKGKASASDNDKPAPSERTGKSSASAKTAPSATSKTTAATGPALPVRIGSHPDYTRLVFDWPKSVAYRVDQSGGMAKVMFKRPASVDIATINAGIPEPFRTVQATSGDGGLVVTFPIPEGASFRHYADGKKVVVDLLLGKETAEAKRGTTPSASEAPAATAKQVPLIPTLGSPPQAEPVVAGTPPVTLPTLVPSPPSPTGEKAAVNEPAKGGGETAKAVEAKAPDPEADTPARRAAKSRVASLSFSWTEQTAASIFMRNGWLWAVFDRPLQVDTKLLTRLGGGLLLHVEQLQSKGSTVVRMLVEPGYYPSVRREGLLWIVDLMRQPARPAHPLDVEMQPKSPVGPRIFIPVPDAGKALVLEDPEVGDRFIVVPVVPLGNGIYPERGIPDLTLPITAQGVLVNAYSEKVLVNSSRNGIEITGQGGLLFSPDIGEMKAMADVGADTDLRRVFDIQNWMRGSEDQFLNNKHLLQMAVASAPDARRENARLDLARFFFANGFEAETLGILRAIAADRPEAENSGAFRALRGAASYLMGRYDEAIADLSHQSLDPVEEAQFWRAAAQSEISDPSLQADVLKKFGAVLSTYPRWVKVPLALTAARATVAAADDMATNNFIAAARVEDNTGHEKAAIGYIEGRLAEASGNYDAAKDRYTEITETSDRLYRTLAMRDLLELLYRLQEIDRPNLIKGLERLRFSWRGGMFEYDLLMRLGELYTEESDWGKALRVWQQVATYFKDHGEAEVAAKRMQDTFEKLYFDGLADQMSPISSIALYDEFRELTPTGPKGDEMIRRLADRLVSVDLLQQSARLLERQIAYRLEGVERSRVGARLGLVYLLDRQPDKAVEALLKTKAEPLPEGLVAQRQRLMARALSDLDRPEEAIALLEKDNSREADLLRTEVYWRAKNWQAAADMLEVLTPEASSDGSLTQEQARLVLDRATALTLAQNDRGVVGLRARYQPMMDKTPYKDAFDLLTSPPESGMIDYRTVSKRIKKVEDFKSFLQSYQDRLRAEGLSAIN